MVDVNFTRMHCGRTSFHKQQTDVCWKISISKEVILFVLLKFFVLGCFSWRLLSVVFAWYPQCILIKCTCCHIFLFCQLFLFTLGDTSRIWFPIRKTWVCWTLPEAKCHICRTSLFCYTRYGYKKVLKYINKTRSSQRLVNCVRSECSIVKRIVFHRGAVNRKTNINKLDEHRMLKTNCY